MRNTTNYGLKQPESTDLYNVEDFNSNMNVIDENLSNVEGKINNKVDKITGKGLSTNDYTTEEKNKLNGIAEGANKYTHPAYTAKASGLYKITVDNTGHINDVTAVTKSDITALGIPASNTDTHYTSKNVVNKSATSTSNTTTALDNGEVYLISVENGGATSAHKISGSGATTVTTDASGNIVISSTDTNTTYTHPASGVVAGTYRNVTVDANGHITSGSNPTMTIVQGGTGATTAKGAEYNITNGMTEVSTELADNTLFAGVYMNPDATQGRFYSRQTVTIWNYIKAKLSSVLGLTATSYGGNASTATTATKIGSSTLGSTTQPVYINAGTPAKCTYTLGKSVPSDAVFTDTVYTHPTTAGNKHIPSGGASGQILRWSADGTATWGDDNNSLTGVKGNAESSYRTGNVNITPANIGLGNVNNTSDADKPISTATQTALDKKPENVSELFNFNTFDGDINSLAVGMYVYFKGDMYPSPSPTGSTGFGTHEGWGKILSISASNNTCQIGTTQLFGEQVTPYIESAYTNNLNQQNFTKIESIQLILTEQEAKYLGMLSSVWGGTQGGLTGIERGKLNLSNASLTLDTKKSYLAIARTSSAMQYVAVIYYDSSAFKVTSLNSSGTLGCSISGNTATFSNQTGSAFYVNYIGF